MIKDNKWISVKNALPKKLERVLVVCTNPWSVNDIPHVTMATYWGTPYGKPTWSRHRNVTHWMQPPELPDFY